MILDCFTFFDELDMLEIRLNILYKHVDKFILTESNRSYTGRPKDFIFEKNRDRFAQWNDKIIYHKLDFAQISPNLVSLAFASPNTGGKEHFWIREFCIKEYVVEIMTLFKDDDWVFISDLDEIWNPAIDYTQYADNRVYRPVQMPYAFYLNMHSGQGLGTFTGTRCGKVSTLKRYGANHFRTEREVKSVLIPNGGWHFSWLHKTTQKWNDGHPDDATRLAKIREYSLTLDNINLPRYLIDNKEKWLKYFYVDNQI